jgi:hypothetical protein
MHGGEYGVAKIWSEENMEARGSSRRELRMSDQAQVERRMSQAGAWRA